LIDDIVSGKYKKYVFNNDNDGNQTNDIDPQSKSADSTPFDIARLAGLTKQGYNKLDQLSQVGGPQQHAQQPPQALPAPSKPDIDLTPDLRQKQAEPTKKKRDES